MSFSHGLLWPNEAIRNYSRTCRWHKLFKIDSFWIIQVPYFLLKTSFPFQRYQSPKREKDLYLLNRYPWANEYHITATITISIPMTENHYSQCKNIKAHSFSNWLWSFTSPFDKATPIHNVFPDWMAISPLLFVHPLFFMLLSLYTSNCIKHSYITFAFSL